MIPTLSKTKFSEIKEQLERRTQLTDYPVNKREPIIFTPQRFGHNVAYQLLVNQKELRELIPGYACADAEPDSIHIRAALLSACTPKEGILAQESALWLYQGGIAPRYFTFFYSPFEKRPQGKHVRGIKKRLYPNEITKVLGISVTTPERTAKDLGLDQEILAPVIR